MAVTGFPDLAVNLIYTVLCLVPGFITLQTARYVSGRALEFDQFDKSVWSLVASGLSLSVLYFAYAGWVALTSGRLRLVVAVDLQWPELVAAYPLLLAVAILVGYAAGRLITRYEPTPTRIPTQSR